jgi:hypothetical protein
LRQGAQSTEVDAFGKRPIDYAREGGHAAVVQVLRNAKQ